MKTPRIQSLLAALVLLTSSSWAAAAAPARSDAKLPQWRVATESQYAWRNIEFRDTAGELRSLWCRRSECGPDVKAGRAKLYFFEVESISPWGGWGGKDSGKGQPSGPLMISYKTLISNFEYYDAASGKVVTADGAEPHVALESPRREKSGTVFRVKPPHGTIHHIPARAASSIGRSPRQAATPRSGGGKGAIKNGAAVAKAPTVAADVKKDPETKPEARTAANPVEVLDLKELDKNEIENLTEAEKAVYQLNLDQAKKKEPKDAKAISDVISKYRGQASANEIATMPMTMEAFNALPRKEQKNKFCDVLDHSPNGGYIGGKVIKRALDQGKAAVAGADAAKSIIDGAGKREDDAVEAAPQPHITATETSKLNEACKAFRADKPAVSGGPKKTAGDGIEGSPANSSEGQGGDCEKKDGKCVAKDSAADMKMLAKAGAAGAVAGAVILMLGGPAAGAVMGAIAVFALAFTALKLLK